MSEPNETLKVKQKLEETKATKSATKSKLNSFLNYLPNILINLFAVIALWIMTVLVLDFDANYLLSFRGVATTIVLTILFTSTHWSMYDMRVKKQKRDPENKEYIKENIVSIKKVTATVTWLDHKEEFVNDRNLEKKIEQWKILIENRIVKIEKKAKKKDLDIEAMGITDFQRQHLSEQQVLDLQAKIDKEKNENRYLQRKKLLEEMRTNEWIAENIMKKNISYDKIDTMFIETGSVVKGQEKTKVEKKGKYAKDNIGQRIFSLVIAIFLTAISTDLGLSGFTTGAWFILAFRIIIWTYNVVMGVNYGDIYYAETDIHNIESRVALTDEFKVWALKKGYIK